MPAKLLAAAYVRCFETVFLIGSPPANRPLFFWLMFLGIATSLPTEGLAADKTLQLPATPFPYSQVKLPPHFETPAARLFETQLSWNPTTDAGATLGRVLFYETRLSQNNTTSCGSCHHQKHAFSDPRRFSVGYQGRVLDRNSMSLVNLRFSPSGKFWDERTALLEEQVLQPIQSQIEMGHDLQQVVAVLSADPVYPPLFKAAFADPEITSERVAQALSQFVRALVSYQSKYDAGLQQVTHAGEDFPNYTDEENAGKKIFLEKCAICHRSGRGEQEAFFTMFTALNNGIDPHTQVRDGGKGDITFLASDVGLFKAPSLRNIEHTAPYMHDGRLQTLEDVVEHYSTSIQRHPSVSGFATRMQFRPEQKTALVAFLKTLSDPTFLTAPEFSDPWKSSEQEQSQQSILPALASQQAKPAEAATEGTLGELNQRLAQQQGLPPGETQRWLLSLDRNADGALNSAEYERVIDVIATVGTPLKLSGASRRLARARAPGLLTQYDQNADGELTLTELPPEMQSLFVLADINADHKISAEEADQFSALKNFVALGDNRVDPTRLDRFLAQYRLPPLISNQAKQFLREQLDELHLQSRAQEAAFVELTRKLLSESQFQQFQELILQQQNTVPRGPNRPAELQQRIRNNIAAFDINHNDQFDAEEIQELARVLNESPGGFGCAAPAWPGTDDLVQRIMSFDLDDSGTITLAEAPERMQQMILRGAQNPQTGLSRLEVAQYIRNSSFDDFLEEGVYVGGGFMGVFQEAKPLLASLQLDQQSQQQLETRLDQLETDRLRRNAQALEIVSQKLVLLLAEQQ